ncbi:hypothetical protein BIV60_20440 [Bacillus sp. MUM 116]|nr:hypothetical protein BIV60_20440 [Bacillus sp. MUM 116]
MLQNYYIIYTTSYCMVFEEEIGIWQDFSNQMGIYYHYYRGNMINLQVKKPFIHGKGPVMAFIVKIGNLMII